MRFCGNFSLRPLQITNNFVVYFNFEPFTRHPNEKRDKLTYRFACFAYLTIPDPRNPVRDKDMAQLLSSVDMTGLRRVVLPLAPKPRSSFQWQTDQFQSINSFCDAIFLISKSERDGWRVAT